MNIDRKKYSKVVEDKCYRFLIYKDKIYYAAFYYPSEEEIDYGLYSCNIDGSGKKSYIIVKWIYLQLKTIK